MALPVIRVSGCLRPGSHQRAVKVVSHQRIKPSRNRKCTREKISSDAGRSGQEICVGRM